MKSEDFIAQYRIVEGLHALMDITLRMRHENEVGRVGLLRTARASVGSRFAVMCTAAVAVLAFCFSAIPESARDSLWVIVPFVSVVVGLSGFAMAREYMFLGRELNAIVTLIGQVDSNGLEDDEKYLLTRVSFAGTKRSIALQVLSSSPSPSQRAKFESIKAHWEADIERLTDRIKVHLSRITDETLRQRKSKMFEKWLEQARCD